METSPFYVSGPYPMYKAKTAKHKVGSNAKGQIKDTVGLYIIFIYIKADNDILK